MEAAGKLVEDEELRDAMKEKGLGTPATRASIIETLISAHYLVRHGKELQPTPKAIQTITLLKNAVPELTIPELTGEWEFRLHEIEHRKLTRDAFMRDIRELTNDIVGKAKHFHPDEHMPDTEPFGKCPKCGSPIVERFKSFTCTNEECDFTIWKTIAGRFSRDGWLSCAISRSARWVAFVAGRNKRSMRCSNSATSSNRVRFRTKRLKTAPRSRLIFSTEPLGDVQNTVGAYSIWNELRLRKFSRPDCDFRSGKVILQRAIEHGRCRNCSRREERTCSNVSSRARAGRSMPFSF
jgi:DNA topoisomerase-3